VRGQIIATTGAPLSKLITSHVLRRTVAARLAELYVPKEASALGAREKHVQVGYT
jgi:hypothetical protein